MAEILPFVKEKGTRTRRAAPRAGEVVIFPGVRFEYHDPAPTPSDNRPRGKRSRRKTTAAG
jgi:hypothetical protein